MSKVIRETVHGADGWNSPLEVDIKVSDKIEVPDEDDQEQWDQIFMEVVQQRDALQKALSDKCQECEKLEAALRDKPWVGPDEVRVKEHKRHRSKSRMPQIEVIAAMEPSNPTDSEASGQTEASGEATEGLLDTPDSLGPTINLRTTYQQIYDAAKCPHCQKLLKSENPEERCRCGE